MLVIFVILSFLALIFPFLSLRGVYPRSNLFHFKEIASAAEQPRNDINKFGIHIINVTDLEKAQNLVNSSGGDWGWVTVVIRDDEMDFDKWQGFMNECRERHIVPLVRVATHLEGVNWAKPKIEDAEKWAEFLNKLNWPTSDRYIIVYNEPNHAKEWGGEINPQEYTRILRKFISQFEILNTKYLILNSGFDLAAPNSKTTMESFQFMRIMNEEIPGIFEQLDGWASHSYANHGFLGKPWENKKTSIRGYEFELNYLKKLGVKKEFPVYITETGWPKDNSKLKTQISKPKRKTQNYYQENTVAEYIKYAFENVWLRDQKVKAVTPFVLDYPSDLFYAFSWFDKEGKPFSQYEICQAIPKQSWRPPQEDGFSIESITLPPFMPADTVFNAMVILKNTGESIWGEYGNTIFKSSSDKDIYLSDLEISGQKIKPGEKISLDFTLISKKTPGIFNLRWGNNNIGQIKVFPATVINKVNYGFWQKVIMGIKEFFGK